MKVSALKLHKRNPRQISREAMDKLKQSIERDPEFMTLRPMVVDTNNVVQGGNQRLKAIRELGYKDIPDTWVVKADDLDPEKLRRFMLVDNAPQGMAGDWDIDLLANGWELPELEHLGFDVDSLNIEELVPENEKIVMQEEKTPAFKKAHVLISFHPDDFIEIKPFLEKIKEKIAVEIEQGGN